MITSFSFPSVHQGVRGDGREVVVFLIMFLFLCPRVSLSSFYISSLPLSHPSLFLLSYHLFFPLSIVTLLFHSSPSPPTHLSPLSYLFTSSHSFSTPPLPSLFKSLLSSPALPPLLRDVEASHQSVSVLTWTVKELKRGTSRSECFMIFV